MHWFLFYSCTTKLDVELDARLKSVSLTGPKKISFVLFGILHLTHNDLLACATSNSH